VGHPAQQEDHQSGERVELGEVPADVKQVGPVADRQVARQPVAIGVEPLDGLADRWLKLVGNLAYDLLDDLLYR